MDPNSKSRVEGSTLEFCRNIEKGLFILSGDDRDALNNCIDVVTIQIKVGHMRDLELSTKIQPREL